MTKIETTPTIDELLAQIRSECAALEIARAKAQAEADVCADRVACLERRFSAIQVATSTLKNAAAIPELEASHGRLVAWRKAVANELLALPAQTCSSREVGIRENLELSLALIDGTGGVGRSGYSIQTLRLGQLMIASGIQPSGADAQRHYEGELTWPGSLPQVEQRLARLKKDRDDAQAQLDAAIHDYQASTATT